MQELQNLLPPDGWMDAPTQTIMEAICKTNRYLNISQNIICSVSGGSDSDIMVDMVQSIDRAKKVRYVFFDTGLEMQATKDHIRYLENRYGIKIAVEKPHKSIPIACKEYGLPFISKSVSENIERLQRNHFKWEIDTFEALLKRYPNCKSALRWWCNEWGADSRFNISSLPFLKDFMSENPPAFKISPKCCDYAKKSPAHQYAQKVKADLTLLGIRKAEGGARSTAYKSCFIESGKHGDLHFPIFWFDNTDKEEYVRFYGIKNSAAYTTYGCKRTGCAACPFGSRFEEELVMLQKNEPNLFKAAYNIFRESIEYTRAYRKFKAEKSNDHLDEAQAPEQLTLEDIQTIVVRKGHK